jgi:hypothetical protein
MIPSERLRILGGRPPAEARSEGLQSSAGSPPLPETRSEGPQEPPEKEHSVAAPEPHEPPPTSDLLPNPFMMINAAPLPRMRGPVRTRPAHGTEADQASCTPPVDDTERRP